MRPSKRILQLPYQHETTQQNTGEHVRFRAAIAPSGKRLLHRMTVLDENMEVEREIDFNGKEHRCLGRHPIGHNALFSVNWIPSLKGVTEIPPVESVRSLRMTLKLVIVIT